MLDPSDVLRVTDTLWNKAHSCTVFPGLASAPTREGANPGDYETRRAFHRFKVDRRGILVHGKNTHGVFVKDFSKGGVAFFAPFQLFPNEAVWLLLPEEEKKFQVRARRCRRKGDQCYEVGAEFVGGDQILPSDVHGLMGSGI